jgi:DNA-binding CsgD family transcriptional regulator/N-acetylneuraminic acid mutarotase
MDMQNPEPNELSERELGILRLVATGASNKEIAQKLFISSNTVKVHLRNIFTKIGVTSRTEAAMYAVRTGLVVHTPSQGLPEETDEYTTDINGVRTQTASIPITGEAILHSSKRTLRWAPFIIIVVFIGLIFLGLRLSPSLAIFSTPTSSPLPPRQTPTSIPHWNHLAALPVSRSDPALVAYGDQIYAIGGLNSQGVFGGLDRYDPQSDTWKTLLLMPSPVFNTQAAVINGLIYVPGGRPSIENMQPTNILAIYNTNTDEWNTGASLPIPLSGYGLVAYDGDLYVFGGWDGQKYLNTVYVYDPTNNVWQEHTPMSTARAFCGVAEAGGRIYVIGGINENHTVDANEIYSPARDNNNNNPWTSGFPIPESRAGIRAVNIADTIYVFGGEEQNSNRVGLIYFPQTNIWQSLETSPYPLGVDFGMTAIGTNLFFIGGLLNSTYSDQNLTYQAIITLSIPIIIK